MLDTIINFKLAQRVYKAILRISQPDGVVPLSITQIFSNLEFVPKLSNKEIEFKLRAGGIDVGVLKTSTRAKPGFEMSYYLYFYNAEENEAGGVFLEDILPGSVTFISATGDGVYDSNNHKIVWNIGSLTQKQKGQFTLKVKVREDVLAESFISNLSSIKAEGYEFNPTDNISIVKQEVLASYDPNDMVVLPEGYIKPGQLLNLSIRFENLATATAEATNIMVENQLSEYLDLETLQVSAITVGSITYAPDGYTRGSLTFGLNLGKLTWSFTNIDLFQNKVPPEGEGMVSYLIKVKDCLPSGTRIGHQAKIRFDYNPYIETPEVENIIDLEPPISAVNPIPQYSTSNNLNLSWSGTDTGSGITECTIYASENEGVYQPLISGSQTSMLFTGTRGCSYSFFSTAKDSLGNIEPVHSLPDARTLITYPPEVVSISPSKGRIGRREVEVIGKNLLDSPIINLVGKDQIEGTNTSLIDSERLWVSFEVKEPGTYSLILINPDGQEARSTFTALALPDKVEVIGKKKVAVGEKIPLTSISSTEPDLNLPEWKILEGKGSLSSQFGTTTTFTASENGEIVVSVQDETVEGSITITADYLPNIILYKSADKKYILPGQEVTYTINYGNIGQGTATDVNIIEVLPENTSLKSATGNPSYYVANKWQPTLSPSATKLKWLIPEVAPNQSGSVSFTVKVK